MTAPVKRYHPNHPHIDGRDVVLASDYERLEKELALALKCPSVAAMHTYLDTVCAKQNAQFGAERDAALKQVEALLDILRSVMQEVGPFELGTDLCDRIDAALQAKL